MPRRNANDRQGSSAWAWIIGIIVVAAIGFVIWYFLTQTGDSNSVDTPSPVPTSLTVTATPSPTI